MQPQGPASVSMHARRRAGGLIGKVLDTGPVGYLSVVGRTVSWTAGGTLRWSVDAGQVAVLRRPSTVQYDLVLGVSGEEWRFIVDVGPVNTFTRGLIIAARRRDAALTMVRLIEEAKRVA